MAPQMEPELRQALPVQQNLIADRGNRRLIDHALGSLAGEFHRRFGGNISGEQKRTVIVRNDHPAIARRQRQRQTLETE